jgi:hypothetical protein
MTADRPAKLQDWLARNQVLAAVWQRYEAGAAVDPNRASVSARKVAALSQSRELAA